MVRIKYAEAQNLLPEYRHLLPAERNIPRILANSPQLAARARAIADCFQRYSPLPPRLREMAIIQVGYLTRSSYEYAHHIKIGLTVGLSEADIRAIADETAGRMTGLDPLAKSVLRAAREVTEDLEVSIETFDALRSAFDDAQLVDLIYAISIYNAVVRILASFQIELEDGYEVYLERFPFD